MPARANSRIDARSQELTKNLVHTRHQLENHFKSIKRREADFKKQKLVNIEEELKATARMARPALAPEGSSRRQQAASPRDHYGSSAPAPSQQRAQSSEQLAKTWSGALNRSNSSPEGWPSAAAPPTFPLEWGGHGVMPKPAGSPAAFPLAVTRACADCPASMHPPPHPGSLSMKPAKTRSMAAFATSYTAAVLTPSSPQAPGSPSGRRPAGTDRSLYRSLASPKEDFGEELVSPVAGSKGESLSEKDPMIKRLGHFMALLGPRYKTVSKEMIWEQAARGERSPAQRRLHKLGGIEAVGGGPDLSLRASSSAPGLDSDSDGKARAQWLAARTAERDKRNRAARSGAR